MYNTRLNISYFITFILIVQNILYYYIDYKHIPGGVNAFVHNCNSYKIYKNIIDKTSINKYNHYHIHKLSDKSNDNNNPKKPKSTKFDRIIDDFIGKKYGAGEAFYGKRTSGLTEEEYDMIRYKGKKSQTDEMNDYDEKDMKSNAILVYGDINISLLSWIVLELLEKGFTVRLASTDRNQAIEVFGSPGMNIDMIELKSDSPEKVYARAIQDVQAIIFCDNFEPVPSPFLNKVKSNFITMERLLDISLRARKATVGEVQKLVMLSRYIPSSSLQSSTSAVTSQQNPLASITGSIAYYANKLLTDVINAEDDVYMSFRDLHRSYEDKIRSSGIEYVIIRAPATVIESRPGSIDNLEVIQKSTTTSSSVTRFIGALDLAEAAIQSLLLDQIEGITYTVQTITTSATSTPQSSSSTPRGNSISNTMKNNPMDNTMAATIESSSSSNSDDINRITRSTYYGILSLDDSTDPIPLDEVKLDSKQKNVDKDKLLQEIDASNALSYSEMRSTYMIRPVENYRSQIEEDERVEKYWFNLLRNLPRD